MKLNLLPVGVFFIQIFILLSCQKDLGEKRLKELDKELYCLDVRKSEFQNDIAMKYADMANAWTDSMVWEAAYELFDSYCIRNSDSAMVYLQRMYDTYNDSELVFRNKVCRARIYAETNHSKLENLMSEIVGCKVNEAFYDRYLMMVIDIYTHCPELSSYASHYIDYLEQAIHRNVYSEDKMAYLKGLRASAYNLTNEAISSFNHSFNISDNSFIKGASAEALAGIYRQMSNRQLEKDWLISASLYQLRSLQGEQTALYKLSLILSDEGQYDRSAKYISEVIERASISGFPELVVGSAQGSLAVNATLDKIEDVRQNIFTFTLTGTIAALILILVMFVRDKKNSALILKTKDSLVKSNEQLVDVNKIKDGYLIRYMNLCVSYLGMIEDNRRLFRRKMKEGGVESLMAELRKPSTAMGEYKEFYKTFDNVFLGIYPDFVRQVNQCFKEEDHFKVNGKLTTQLRILALIRLGFTESGDIARFLNCSPQTIYSQRSKLKARAICEGLEEKIKCIGR